MKDSDLENLGNKKVGNKNIGELGGGNYLEVLAKEKEETVTISKKEYESLLDDSEWRCAMEAAGVDNWEGYDFALKLLNEDE